MKKYISVEYSIIKVLQFFVDLVKYYMIVIPPVNVYLQWAKFLRTSAKDNKTVVAKSFRDNIQSFWLK